MTDRRRTYAFAALVAACVVAGAVVVVLAATGGSGPKASSPSAIAAAAAKLPTDDHGQPTAVFLGLDRARPGTYGRVAVAPLAHLERRTLTNLTCMRVAFAGGHGVCLRRAGGVIERYEAVVFGRDLRPAHVIRLSGIPSRTRVSPDGRYGASTVFVSGDSYNATGNFSTRTVIYDLASGRTVGDLERFDVTLDGRRVAARDRNYWGVTFSPEDSDHFYATLSTGGQTHLIEGSVTARAALAIHDNVECPSISPDGTRIAYKKRVGKPAVWRFHVLDLETMRETALAETKPIDDQIAWLDDENVLYHDGEETWTVPADGSGAPRRWLAKADSATIARP
jgi:hypothetical protein